MHKKTVSFLAGRTRILLRNSTRSGDTSPSLNATTTELSSMNITTPTPTSITTSTATPSPNSSTATRTKRASGTWLRTLALARKLRRPRRAATNKKGAQNNDKGKGAKVIKFDNADQLKKKMKRIVKKPPKTESHTFKPIPPGISVKVPKGHKSVKFTRKRTKPKFCNNQCKVCCKKGKKN